MKPFIKWAGGKFQILDNIKSMLPRGKRLIEPFTGAGSVFLNTDYSNYILGEVNGDLINLYEHLKREGQVFIDYCRNFFIPENNCKTCFYELRDLFNTTTDQRLKAALFIYLNRHAFNGLCRYNSSGKFNVPFGAYEKVYFTGEAMLNFHIKSKAARFYQQDFTMTMNLAKKGDVVYCDPPYVPLSKTASFTTYSTNGFNESQQILLAEKAEALAARNIPVLISNHDTPFTRELYQSAQIISFSVKRHISSKADQRGNVMELLALFGEGGTGFS